jgi:DUF971 family protein
LVKPRSIALNESGVVIEWKDGHRGVYSNAKLREACPCALCQGERTPLGPVGALPVIPSVPADVMATKCRTVGLYAFSFSWSDGHDSGIYPYDYLREICECEECTKKRSQVLNRTPDVKGPD